MSDEIRVRRMREADLERVLQIEHESYSTPWPESSFRGLLRRSDATLLVADTNATVAGYAVSWAVLDQGELGNIAVAPEYRRRGIARVLIEAVIDDMKDRGVRELFLEVRVSNVPAQTLYDQYGFEVIGRRRNYYENPVEDALVMRRMVG